MKTHTADKLPHSLEAETLVLGSMLLDDKVIAELRSTLTPEDYFSPRNQILCRQLYDLFDSQRLTEATMVCEALKTAGQTQNVTDDYVYGLVQSVPSVAAAGHYATLVKEKSQARRLISTLTDGIGRLYDQRQQPDTIIAGVETETRKIIQDNDNTARASTVPAAVEAAHQAATRAYEGHSDYLQTGFCGIDSTMAGFAPGELITLAGKTGTGKTSFATNIAANVMGNGGAVFYVSAEMPTVQMGKRILQLKAEVPGTRIRRGRDLTEADFTKMATACGETAGWKGYIYSRAAGVPEISAETRRVVAKWGAPLDLVIIDYLQLLRPNRSESRNQQVGSMARALKDLAIDAGCPVLMLSQLNRNEGKDAKPTLSMLRDSGEIEQHSDAVIFLWVPPTPDVDIVNNCPRTWLKIAKCRDGRVTSWEGEHAIRLYWEARYTRFRSAAKEYQYGHATDHH